MDSDRETGYYIETMLEAMYLHKKIEFQYFTINEKLSFFLKCSKKSFLILIKLKGIINFMLLALFY